MRIESSRYPVQFVDSYAEMRHEGRVLERGLPPPSGSKQFRAYLRVGPLIPIYTIN